MARDRMKAKAEYGAEEEIHDRFTSEEVHDQCIERKLNEKIDHFE